MKKADLEGIIKALKFSIGESYMDASFNDRRLNDNDPVHITLTRGCVNELVYFLSSIKTMSADATYDTSLAHFIPSGEIESHMKLDLCVKIAQFMMTNNLITFYTSQPNLETLTTTLRAYATMVKPVDDWDDGSSQDITLSY